MHPASNTPLSAISAMSHKAVGWLDFRLGRLERARYHYERALQLKGDDFAAYVHLGRIAYRLGDYAGWRRECGHARRTSPQRYARLQHPFELFEPRAAGSVVGETSTWRSLRLSRVGNLGNPVGPDREPWAAEQPRPEGRLPEGPRNPDPARIADQTQDSEPPRSAEPPRRSEQERCRSGAMRAFGDDFSSDVEREHFEALAPISSDELLDLDLNELSRRLSL